MAGNQVLREKIRFCRGPNPQPPTPIGCKMDQKHHGGRGRRFVCHVVRTFLVRNIYSQFHSIVMPYPRVHCSVILQLAVFFLLRNDRLGLEGARGMHHRREEIEDQQSLHVHRRPFLPT